MSQLPDQQHQRESKIEALGYHDDVFIPNIGFIKKQESQKSNIELNKLQQFSNATSGSRRPPNEQDLIKAIQCLRNKLPNRSLEQIIIRLRQTVNFKQSVNASEKGFDTISVNSRANDFEDDRSEIDFREGHYFNINGGSNQMIESQAVGSSEDIYSNQKYKFKERGLQQMESEGQLQTGINYIYKPNGPEVIVQFKQIQNLKTTFLNIEEETHYNERRVMAKSFVQRGYGTQECRSQIKALGIPMVLHRNTYKTLGSSVIILAFRKLQSFIANQCGKKIKFLDRWQMSALRTPLLNCRTTLEPQQTQTLLKYIRASYALGDVVIGQVQSVKLYLSCLKFTYGNNVSMQMLERMGEVQHRKSIQLTLQYLNRKKRKRQMRLFELRQKNATLPHKKRGRKSHLTPEEYNEEYQQLNDVKIQSQFNSNQRLDIKLEENGNTIHQNQYTASKKSGQIIIQSKNPLNVQNADGKEVKMEEDIWTHKIDFEMAKYILEGINIPQVVIKLKDRYRFLQNMSHKEFIKKYQKLLKRCIAKVQYETQLLASNTQKRSEVIVLNRLSKSEMKLVVQDCKGKQVRLMLLSYYIGGKQNPKALRHVTKAVLKLLQIKEQAIPEDVFDMMQSIDMTDMLLDFSQSKKSDCFQ